MSETWRDERRRDRLAAVQAQAMLAAAKREQDREDAADRDRRHAATIAARQAAHDAARDRQRAARAAARAWIGAHTVDLLIYPLAVVSAAMAVPAMASWGVQEYGDASGVLLPAISELGMWAFSLAVVVSRRRDPDRSVWALQLGVAVFAAAGMALNFLHGLTHGAVAGVVMAVVSVAGVLAHQLVSAGARRTRAERDATRAASRVRRRVRRFERAALDRAVARIDVSGAVSLVVAPGTYTLTRTRRLATASVPGLPVDPTDDLDRELAALLDHLPATELIEPCGPGESRPDQDEDTDRIAGPIATLDPGPDHDAEQQKSSPDRPRIGGRVGRSIDQLRVQLRAVIEADPAAVDLGSAESIRRALHCAPKFARQLRDEFHRD